MTYRERREARAARLRGWAEKREEKAGALIAANEPYRGDTAFWTQPGRIIERERASARSMRAWEHHEKAEGMEARASGIEKQLDRSIYSDDPDAIEQLEARIAGLETERDRKKAHNVAIRRALKGQPESEWPRIIRDTGAPDFGWRPGCGIWMVTHQLQNDTANIARNRERLEGLRVRASVDTGNTPAAEDSPESVENSAAAY